MGMPPCMCARAGMTSLKQTMVNVRGIQSRKETLTKVLLEQAWIY